ncbi:hypothetical protein [Nannocystis pusilla]|uniref:hypothetical protein n=1 Tax=Nannocystis pusilla TaxID=889268 RepID=UPI003B77B13E
MRWLAERPRELFAELQRERPIFATPGLVLVTRQAEAIEVLTRGDVFLGHALEARRQPLFGGFSLDEREGRARRRRRRWCGCACAATMPIAWRRSPTRRPPRRSRPAVVRVASRWCEIWPTSWPVAWPPSTSGSGSGGEHPGAMGRGDRPRHRAQPDG